MGFRFQGLGPYTLAGFSEDTSQKKAANKRVHIVVMRFDRLRRLGFQARGPPCTPSTGGVTCKAAGALFASTPLCVGFSNSGHMLSAHAQEPSTLN